MTAKTAENKASINVTSEIGQLRRIMIHRPDIGIGKIIPTKFQDWMYDDIVHLASMKKEYDEYIKILLYFLDPEKIDWIRQQPQTGSPDEEDNDSLNPGHPRYFNSDKVIDVQTVLGKLLSLQTADGVGLPLRCPQR